VTNRLVQQAMNSEHARKKYGVESWLVQLTSKHGRLNCSVKLSACSARRQFAITVFGSAPLQICVDSSLTSAEVNVFSDFEELRELVTAPDSARTKPSSTFRFQAN